MRSLTQEFAAIVEDCKSLFIADNGDVELSHVNGNTHKFRTPSEEWDGCLPPSLTRIDKEGKRRELSDEEILRPYLVSAYAERIDESGIDHESEDGPQLGESGLDIQTVGMALKRLFTMPTKCKGETEFTPGLGGAEAEDAVMEILLG